MGTKTHKFKVSQTEIKRRKAAFLTLFSSLLLGLLISLFVIKSICVSIGLISFASFFLILSLIGIVTFKGFKSFSKITILLNNEILERVTSKTREKYLIKDIERVFIKWTSNKTIREIKIYQKGRISLCINALEDFEVFYNKLKTHIGIEVEIKEFKEPIDFDHRFFYLFFGFPIGMSIPVLMSVFINLEASITRFIFYLVFVFICVLGLFFIIAKPLSKSYGNHKRLTDLLFGLVLLIIGCVVFLQNGLYNIL